MRLHSPIPAVIGAGSFDDVPAALRAGGSIVLGVEIEVGTAVLGRGGDADGWAALLRAGARRGRMRAGEATPAGWLARALGEGARAVTVLLGGASSVATAATQGEAARHAAQWRSAFDVAIAVDPRAAGSASLLRRARRLGLTAVLIEDAAAPVEYGADEAGENELETAPLLARPGRSQPSQGLPASAMRVLAWQCAERAGTHADELLDATARLVERCRIDPAADLGWGTTAAPVALTGLELGDITHRIDDAGLRVQHDRVDDALDLLGARFPGSALLPDGGLVLDGGRVPLRGKRRGLPVSAFGRDDCRGLGLTTIAVAPDRELSALALARAEAGGSTLSATGLAALFPAAMTAGALEHGVPVPASAVPVLPGCVVASDRLYRVEGACVRAPLRTLAGLTAAEIDRVLAARPFRTLEDFAARAAPARERMLRLAACGALDALLPGLERAAVLARVRALGSAPQPREQPSDQPSEEPTLFAGLDIPLPPPPPPPHAIETFRAMLDELQVVSAGDLVSSRPGAEVLVAGVRIAGERAPRGSTQLSVRLEDGSGVTECAFPSGAKGAVGSLLAGTRLVLVQGRTRETDSESIAIEAENAWDLKRMWSDWTAQRRRSA
ncbi:hypothetical protein HQQ81_13905 [Microbacteriaceae bacterium VKM Ac-2854]|nr:hypothetical protein [Microbacteriaceae bacterium VKM Ac-2854]